MIALENSGIVAISLRSAQAIFALIVLGTNAYVATWWRSYWHAQTPSQVAFLVFSAVWTLLAVSFLSLVPWRFSSSFLNHKFAILGIEAVTMLFWFAGFLAQGVFLGDRTCVGRPCGAAKAATVFAAFEWVLFVGSMTLAFMEVARSHFHANPSGKSVKSDTNVQMSEGV